MKTIVVISSVIHFFHLLVTSFEREAERIKDWTQEILLHTTSTSFFLFIDFFHQLSDTLEKRERFFCIVFVLYCILFYFFLTFPFSSFSLVRYFILLVFLSPLPFSGCPFFHSLFFIPGFLFFVWFLSLHFSTRSLFCLSTCLSITWTIFYLPFYLCV